MSALYIEALDLNRAGGPAQRLLNYRRPNANYTNVRRRRRLEPVHVRARVVRLETTPTSCTRRFASGHLHRVGLECDSRAR